MKKTFTKLAGGIMAASMILGTAGVAAPQVFADDATTNKIEITNVSGDQGTHEYKAYQVFAGTLDGENGLKNITWGSGFANRLNENRTVIFTGANTAKDLETLFAGVNISKVDGETKGVTAANATDATVIANALDAIKDDAAKVKRFQEIIASELTVADQVNNVVDTANGASDKEIIVSAPGYYMVKDSLAADSSDETALSEYILKVVGTVEVQAKADIPTSTKKVDDDDEDDTATADVDENKNRDNADYDIGDKVPFHLTGTVAGNYEKYTVDYQYKFVDQACYGLNAPENIKVYAVIESGRVQIDPSCYTVSSYEHIENAKEDDEYYYEWSISFADLKSVKENGKIGDKDPVIAGIKRIEVDYEAELNENAVIGATGNRNKSHIEYSNNPYGDGTGKDNDEEVIVFTYKIIVNKVDGNGKELDGAGFTLYKDGVAIGEEQKTGHQFTWKGLDAGDYKLVETTVPDGYNKAADVEFRVVAEHVEGDGDVEGELTSLKIQIKNDKGNYVDAEAGKFDAVLQTGTATTTIENNTGATLPSTGGIGTTIFYIVGAAAAVTAIVLLTTRRRANKED